MLIPGSDSKGISPELLLSRLNFLCCCTIFLYYYVFHHYYLILILALFTFSPFLILQPIVLPTNYSSFLPLHIHSLPLSLFPPPILPQPVTTLPSILHTHHLLTRLLYELYTPLAPCNPWHQHPTLEQQKYTEMHTRATKPSSPHISSPTFCPSFSATFTNHPSFYL
jgi:hypothetical protein